MAKKQPAKLIRQTIWIGGTLKRDIMRAKKRKIVESIGDFARQALATMVEDLKKKGIL